MVSQSAPNVVLEVDPGRYAALLDKPADIARGGAALSAALARLRFARLLATSPEYHGVTRRYGPKLVVSAMGESEAQRKVQRHARSN